MKKQTFTVPVWALSYLINRDKTGLTLAQLSVCQSFKRQKRLFDFLGCWKPQRFCEKNDLDNEPGDCREMEFSVRYTSDELFNRIVCRVDTSRGAPMGRSNNLSDKYEPSGYSGFDRRVPLIDDGYDKGGAYWGFPNNLRVWMSKDGQFWRFYRS